MGGGKPKYSPKKKTPKEYEVEPADETWDRIQHDPRPFDPKLGDQAVKLLDKAISTFRTRRADVMQLLADDVETIKWSNHEMAWIDKKVGELTEHKEKCEARLKEVTEALEKFGEVPDESKAGTDEVENTRGRSVMPLLAVSKAATKHSSLEAIRCNLRLAESGLEMHRGFSMKTKYRPEKTAEERAMALPGSTRYDLSQCVTRLPKLPQKPNN